MKKKKRFFPRLSRRGKTVRNLLLTLGVAALIWAQYGCPLPTVEMEFRRLERKYLFPPSELVFDQQSGSELQANDGTAMEWSNDAVVGVRDNKALVACAQGGAWEWATLNCYPLEEGPVPVPVVMSHLMWVEVIEMSSTPRIDGALLLLRMPQEAAAAELELDVTYRGQEYHRDCLVFHLEDGTWLAAVESPEDPYSSNWYEGGDYTLRLYEENGALLLEKTGSIPVSI